MFLQIQKSPMIVEKSSVIVVWILIAFYLTCLLYLPLSGKSIIGWACLSGFIIYGVYNFTNKATLQQYTIKISLLDTLWGTILLTLVCSLTLALISMLNLVF